MGSKIAKPGFRKKSREKKLAHVRDGYPKYHLIQSKAACPHCNEILTVDTYEGKVVMILGEARPLGKDYVLAGQSFCKMKEGSKPDESPEASANFGAGGTSSEDD